MYKILIVDDDVIIRKGLAQNISWEENGFILLGAVRDGEEALDSIARECPDIIISDVKMPFLDGLALTKIVKARYPDIKVILLSGYDEFEFAKEALKLKAFDYILKPVEKEQLLDIVKMAAWELENEKRVKSQIKESMPLLSQRFLLRLLNGKCNSYEISSQIDFLNIPLILGNSLVISIKADDYLNPSYHMKVMEKELLKYCISNICLEITEEVGHCVLADTGEDEIVLIFTDDALDEDAILKKVYELSEEIRLKIEKFLKTTVTIGVGMIYEGFDGIHKSYNEACSANEFRHMLGKNKVLSFQDTGIPLARPYMSLTAKETDLIQKVKLGLTANAINILRDIRKFIETQKFIPLDSIRLIGTEILILIFREIEGWENYSNSNEYYKLSHEIQSIQTVDEIFNKIELIIVNLCAFVNGEREKQQKSIVKIAMRYIESHFESEGLSLQEVAQNIHISPAYLSIIFKQETGINFTEYLCEIRMKKAMELLRSGNYKTYEVAEKVGYCNSQYFSVSFKKYSGYSPSEFKNCQ